MGIVHERGHFLVADRRGHHRLQALLQKGQVAQAGGQGADWINFKDAVHAQPLEQGGGMGRQLVEGLKKALPNQPLIAVGTNALATAAMLRAGADQVATGENAVVVCAGMADLILCPIGMVLCDAMLGEVTANMALAVGRSKAHKILLPVSRCQASVAGAPKMSMAEVVAKAVEETVTRVSAASV